jgi:hypothetical protein
MLGFVISVVVSTGVVLVTTATTVVTSVVMNVTAATARLGYRYIRDRWKQQPNDEEAKKEEFANLMPTSKVNSSLPPMALFHDSSEEVLSHNLKE